MNYTNWINTKMTYTKQLTLACRRVSGHYTYTTRQQPCYRQAVLPPGEQQKTSNVTTVTEVRSASACLSVRGAPGECYYNSVLCCDCCDTFCHRRVWYRALSLRHVHIQRSGVILMP